MRTLFCLSERHMERVGIFSHSHGVPCVDGHVRVAVFTSSNTACS
ncbi:hypothetical protein SAMN02910291_02595 [Desulfovibrio desulfuricans]|uniref:Uncharacterized protein n=1 Tax=Desulfovibrio desulfuricans TaxID=876 RepID=A0AA94HUV0_DESDE|nr:hypothetical protein SAMN02910291_02595 [Desulfovibrio desulfuricans]SPD35317.1 Hypothetical protein DSVG11_1213 [Desulfovibrio sp. G11]